MYTASVQIGRVLRVGRGWADVTVNHKVRRVNTRPGLLVRAGCHLKIINEEAVALLPTGDRQITTLIQ